jgi:hypothetical protein
MLYSTFFERVNPAALKERKDLFLNNDLAITRDPGFDQEFGIYPVLYVYLSVSELICHPPSHVDSQRKNVVGNTFKSLKNEFRVLVTAIASGLKKRGLLTHLHELDDTDHTFLNQIQNEECKAKVEAQALFRLTEILHILHKRKVIVLVDEYDTPTSYATQYGYSTEVCLNKPSMVWILLNILKANDFFRKVFSPLLKVGVFTFHDLNNEHLRGTLMVGILRVAMAGWLSGVNNLDVVQYLPFIAFYLTAVYRYVCWVNQADIQRRVCLRRWKHSYYTKNRRKNWKVVDWYAMAL